MQHAQLACKAGMRFTGHALIHTKAPAAAAAAGLTRPGTSRWQTRLHPAPSAAGCSWCSWSGWRQRRAAARAQQHSRKKTKEVSRSACSVHVSQRSCGPSARSSELQGVQNCSRIVQAVRLWSGSSIPSYGGAAHIRVFAMCQ